MQETYVTGKPNQTGTETLTQLFEGPAVIPILKSNFLNFALVNKYAVYANNFIVHSIKLVIGVLMSERCVLFYKITCICQF